jgi:NTP pyrophosphatase (non-canonical NTP hydrolase)
MGSEMYWYQKEVGVTYNPDTKLQGWTLGLCGEAGEFAEVVKKVTEHGVTEIKGKDALAAMSEELGDVLYYVAAIANYLNLDLLQIAVNNIKKLRERYPDGFVPGGGIR